MNTIVSIVALVAALWGFFGYVDPHYQTVKQLQTEKAAYQEALVSATQAEQLKASLVTRYNGLDPNALERLKIMLPDSVDPVKFIIELNEIANAAGMPIKNISVLSEDSTAQTQTAQVAATPDSSTAAGKAYGSLSFQFSVSGTYDDLNAFLTALESNLRIIDVSTLSVKYDKGSSYVYTLKVTTYWLK